MKDLIFRDCTVELLEDTFGIEQGTKSPTLTDWLKRSKKTKILIL